MSSVWIVKMSATLTMSGFHDAAALRQWHNGCCTLEEFISCIALPLAPALDLQDGIPQSRFVKASAAIRDFLLLQYWTLSASSGHRGQAGHEPVLRPRAVMSTGYQSSPPLTLVGCACASEPVSQVVCIAVRGRRACSLQGWAGGTLGMWCRALWHVCVACLSDVRPCCVPADL
jgi:hypothetical protein